ncbi:hypothetical protein [Cytobacillus praedii]|uniref:Uncharacterized protein n=1 Tax=Cytobacillus praedii TaxID=1742358 RepID=A0A4R1B2D8_9BACI|nr:hypothetical protein [Cytobacillus praedii]TCJ05066.1 hypothetical protein E0Y62_07575 [Cytobacillus praedii]
MARNPQIHKARVEGYNQGFAVGYQQGKYSACKYFDKKFQGLEDLPGIGEKTLQKITKHFEFGPEYFKEFG